MNLTLNNELIMKPFDFPEKLSKLNKLICQEHTGNPDEFAQRLAIGRSTLYEILDELQSRGVEIRYSRSRRTFYYNNDKILDVRFAIIPLSNISELNEIKNYSRWR